MTQLLSKRRARRFLIASVAVTLLLYWVPFGEYLAYPLVLLSTLAHELGHGLMAELIGGEFESFVLHADGSGAARWSGKTSRLDRAMVAAAGLVGPAIAATACFLVAKRARLARVALVVIGGLLGLALVMVIRNVFGWVFVGLVAVGALVTGLKASQQNAQLALVFVGTQLALSVFSRSDYLFTDTAQTAQGAMPSDVAQISQALAGPYWLWGALAGITSLVVLWGGLHGFLRGARD